jgi:hypothetical protein
VHALVFAIKQKVEKFMLSDRECPTIDCIGCLKLAQFGGGLHLFSMFTGDHPLFLPNECQYNAMMFTSCLVQLAHWQEDNATMGKLHSAAGIGRADLVVEELAGADIDEQDKQGRTALHEAGRQLRRDGSEG